jgi:hypothetical protein
MIVHLCALGAFLSLAWALLRLLVLDWQLRYLKKFASAYSLALTADAVSAKLPPVAIDPEMLAKFHICHHIISMRFYRVKSGREEYALEIFCADPLGQTSAWMGSLAQALSLPITISLSRK